MPLPGAARSCMCPHTRKAAQLAILLAFFLCAPPLSFSQSNPHLQTYFKQDVGLSDDQISAIRNGQAFAKNLHSRNADEIFVFGAVFINAAPESYLQFSRDFARLRAIPGYLALGAFSTPPQLSDVQDFTFDSRDIDDIRHCKPGNCEVQMPATSMEQLHTTLDWSAPNIADQVNLHLQNTVISRLAAYQSDGNSVLGAYDDKHKTTDVSEQFKFMLTYSQALPRYLPDFYSYLLSYPKGKPDNVDDRFYWAKVKFGLKPTLRVIHVLTLRGTTALDPAYAIAEKQLYSDHYFQTALDLTFCIRDSDNSTAPGFYLVKVMGSEQAGLTGFKGSIVRKVAVDRSASSLQKSLAAIKQALEKN